jgi:hypothetical protein
MHSEDDIAVPPIARDESTIYVNVSSDAGQTFPKGDRPELVLRYAPLRLLRQTKNVDIFCFGCLATLWIHLRPLCIT